MNRETTYFNFMEAKKLVDKEYSCCRVVHTKKHMTLSPKYIDQVKSGIKEQLDSELKFYSQVLNGIPIAYRNKLTYAQSAGMIMDDCPYIHFDVLVDCVVFQPRIGSLLLACVNKLGSDHVGCLVHGTFNVSIERPLNVPYSEWEGSKLSGGDEFVFEVVKLHTQSGLLSITGKFTGNSVLQKKRKRTDSLIEETVQFDNNSASSDTMNVSTSDSTTKHKKKKRKHAKSETERTDTVGQRTISETCSDKERLSVGSVDSGIGGVVTSEYDQPEKRKKKKKKKDKDREENDTKNMNGILEGSLKQENMCELSESAFISDHSPDVKQEIGSDDFEEGQLKKKKKHKKHKNHKNVAEKV